MSRGILAWGSAACLGLVLVATPSHANNPNAVRPPGYSELPVARYAAMQSSACIDELDKRKIAYSKAAEVQGVDTPVRLTGELHGIKFTQVNHTVDQALASDGGILDCRLSLALDDFAARLADRHVAEFGFISVYRRDRTGTVKAGQRHPAGLAMDVAWIRKQDGTQLNILRDFHGRIGARTCGARAESPRVASEGAKELRAIVCDSTSGLFNLVLTPNYNREHHNHLHLEVRRSIDWLLVQ